MDALKGANRMAVSVLSLRKILVGTGWGTSLPLHPNGLRKQSPYMTSISGSEASLYEQLTAESCDYCKLINGLEWFESQACTDGCRGSCVKFGG